MIFVSVGTQNFSFDRLLRKLDELIKENKIKDCIFAQTGYTDYKPINYDYSNFLTENEYVNRLKESDLVITHGGTSSILQALKYKKKVIVVPRRKEYKEHIDNHQLEIANVFLEKKYAEVAYDLDELEKLVDTIGQKDFKQYEFNNRQLLNALDQNIREILRGTNK